MANATAKTVTTITKIKTVNLELSEKEAVTIRRLLDNHIIGSGEDYDTLYGILLSLKDVDASVGEFNPLPTVKSNRVIQLKNDE